MLNSYTTLFIFPKLVTPSRTLYLGYNEFTLCDIRNGLR
jgi:hypothetical protein